MSARIYVASSWRNPQQPAIVEQLRGAGHQVYDFRKSIPGGKGFGWSKLGLGDWREWSPAVARDALQHEAAQAGFKSDHDAMVWADTFVMVLPCGRSAHLELGWACGAGKRTFILQTEQQEPELMYLEADRICLTTDELLSALHVMGATHAPISVRTEPDAEAETLTLRDGSSVNLRAPRATFPEAKPAHPYHDALLRQGDAP